ncbi:PD40 domain-containing protein [Maribacter sp. MAR_2009_72]|uniref:PD40 domain-containing protein n=1 Tax=Maribacter sp. MAR_2009_72 TaxID=1250050 RepID=UPI00119A145D|nr:PD40 domain-containing protein [Maribacter sp. MAR_2009_72]TVZ15430.1 WD40 repeat protein [Maribacter sp. MAR_2009_72]
MKNYKLILLLLLLTLFINACNTKNQKANDSDFPALENRYFGQKPPGLIPKPFTPDILSPESSFEEGTYTSDMKSYYFVRNNGKRTFFVIKYENNRWGQESETDIRWPQFSADGNKMFIGKLYKERKGNGWSEPKSPGAFLKHMAHGRSVSAKGTYYFTAYKEQDSIGAIYYSRLVNGKYEDPIRLNDDINRGKYIAGSRISPDESYLIWSVEREGGYGQSDLYISFKKNDGTWSKSINMGPIINTDKQESSPQISPDGKYFFFIRGDWKLNEDGNRTYIGKQHWVDVKVIENLKSKDSE